MKEYLQRLALKVDALSLRERAMMFVIAALALVTLVDTFVLAPLMNIQKQRVQQIKLDQQQIAAMQAEIRAIASGHNIDPDASNKSRLLALKQQSEKLRADLGSIQQSLVAPDRMGALLEDLLKKNKNLQLVSLKTQPVALLSDTRQAGKAPGEKQTVPAVGAKLEQQKPESPATGELVYKHGVELVVQGRYADIATYLSQLESMPWRLFWANASLEVAQHPNVTLTLTLFTISLDRTWLNI
jgi:MSHA biogenesis protein MshJ